MPVRRAGLDLQRAGAKDERGAGYFVIAGLIASFSDVRRISGAWTVSRVVSRLLSEPAGRRSEECGDPTSNCVMGK
jgi:hypothetical protein